MNNTNPPGQAEEVMAPYLIFRYQEGLFAVEAAHVRELVWLPELSPAYEAAHYVPGVFNLRGKIVPVVNIGQLYGHAPARLETTDSVIVYENEGKTIGLLGNEVLDIKEMEPRTAGRLPADVVNERLPHHILEGIAGLEDRMVMLIDPGRLGHEMPEHDAMNAAEEAPEMRTADSLYAGLTEHARAVFRNRAASLRQTEEAADLANALPFAVVRIGGELFGLELSLVKEFVDVRQVVPIPCVPPHVAGYMNLRGTIMVLMDLREQLGALAEGGALPKAVIIKTAQIECALAVSEVVDVAYLDPASIDALPAALGSAADYAMGAARHGGMTFTLIDIEKLIVERSLIVNEEA